VLFDLDNFKKINDRFGHETGDQVLIKFSEILQSSIEKIGVAFRIGGEEFAIMFATNSEIFTLSLTERIRQETEKIIIDETSSDLNVSVSAGVVTSQPNKAVLSEMMVPADRRMYQGKSQGRNVVIHHG
jgi:diguanylate cyclase (GGDEF)-like protein